MVGSTLVPEFFTSVKTDGVELLATNEIVEIKAPPDTSVLGTVTWHAFTVPVGQDTEVVFQFDFVCTSACVNEVP